MTASTHSQIISLPATGWDEVLARTVTAPATDDVNVRAEVAQILQEVRAQGDAAVRRLSKKFDGFTPNGSWEVAPSAFDAAEAALPHDFRKALTKAAKRIKSYHIAELKHHQRSFRRTDKSGIETRRRVTPLKRIGVYAPGGKALYPSTILMAAIPAKVAGAEEIVLVTPPGPEGIAPAYLAAATRAGVTQVLQIGGAHAIGALAYGTESIAPVDKIVGPGNRYVAEAKRQVFGAVDIDGLMGPSEVLIIADGSARADWVAADLVAQAEHDEDARAMCITTSAACAQQLLGHMSAQIAATPRQAIAQKSWRKYGRIFVVRSMKCAADVANAIAPEHLSLCVKNPEAVLKHITAAGAVFLGHTAPEALGDYIAGPSHILPTGGTARFASPVGVGDFLRATSVIRATRAGLASVAGDIRALAEMEGLYAHAASVGIRDKTN